MDRLLVFVAFFEVHSEVKRNTVKHLTRVPFTSVPALKTVSAPCPTYSEGEAPNRRSRLVMVNWTNVVAYSERFRNTSGKVDVVWAVCAGVVALSEGEREALRCL